MKRIVTVLLAAMLLLGCILPAMAEATFTDLSGSTTESEQTAADHMEMAADSDLTQKEEAANEEAASGTPEAETGSAADEGATSGTPEAETGSAADEEATSGTPEAETGSAADEEATSGTLEAETGSAADKETTSGTPEAETTDEEETSLFSQGLCSVSAGTVLYQDVTLARRIGTLACSAVVYAVGRQNTYEPDCDPVEIRYAAAGAVCTAYVRADRVKPLSEDEIESNQQQLNDDILYAGNIRLANVALAADEQPAGGASGSAEIATATDLTAGALPEPETAVVTQAEKKTQEEPVTGFTGWQSSTDDVRFVWDAAPGAAYYELYRKVGQNGVWSKVKNITGESCSNLNLNDGETYCYRVRAVFESDGTKTYSAYSAVVEIVIRYPEVSGLSVQRSAVNSVRLQWNDVSGAANYELHRRTGSGSWVKVKTADVPEAVNLSLTVGKTYAYRVRAYFTTPDGGYYSAWSDTATIVMTDIRVQNVTVYRSALNAVKLTWDEMPGCAYYQLYRKVGGGSWVWVKDVTEAAASNLSLTNGKQYSYKVRACFRTDTGSYKGGFSDAAVMTMGYALPAPENLTAVRQEDSGIRLSWDAVEGAAAYVIYKAAENGSWTRVKSLSALTWVDQDVTFNSTYRYRLYAYCKTGDVMEISDFSSAVSILFRLPLASPQITLGQMGTDRVWIQWEPVENAEYYVLYRSVDGGSWVRIKKTAEASVSNLSLTEGTAYRYRIVPAYTLDDKEIQGESSNAVDFTLGDAFTTVADLTIDACTRTSVSLVWTDDSPDVEEYVLYRSADGGDWTRIKSVNGTSTSNLSLETGVVYAYHIRAGREGLNGMYYSLPSNMAVYWNQDAPVVTVEAQEDGSGRACWEEIAGASSYAVFVDGELVKTTSETEVTLSEEQQGSRISVQAQRFFGDTPVVTAVSAEVEFEPLSKAVYRALLIGETSYVETLNGPDNDVRAMRAVLSGVEQDYSILTQTDATRDEIVDLISIAFSGATEDDVSLFYYSGHGVTGSGEYYSGALQTVDYQYITTQELASLLAEVPGKVIVILDSCGSGAAVSDGTDAVLTGTAREDDAFAFDAGRFNSGVISAFSAHDSVLQGSSGLFAEERAAELRQTKFIVITGSAYEENSVTTQINGVWGGVLTRAFAQAMGCTYPGGIYSGAMPADDDADDALTYAELASYCKSYASAHQNVQSYSGTAEYIMFSR